MIDANEKRLNKLQKELAKEYKAAEKEMLKKAEKYMKAFKEADALELARLKKGEITQAQYDAWRAAKIQRSEWAKRMADELAKGLTDQDVKALGAAKAATTSAATEGSMFAQFEAGTLTGKNFTLVSRSAVEQALTGKLYRRKVNIPKDRAWNERHIRSAIAQSLLQGESVADAAKRISQVAEMNRSAALRDARTMINAAEQSGKLAEYEMLAEEGVDIEKGWMATLDERTRDTHAELDMEFVPVDEKFSNGLMEPCDPDGDPSEVYNCRCTLISKIDGKTISQEERRSKLDRPYEEWKNRTHQTDEASQDGQNSQAMSSIMNDIKAGNVEYIDVNELDKPLTEKEIIERISGGDATEGSCMSLACAYAANKGGLDVLDFRGGASLSTFSKNALNLAQLKGVTAQIIKTKTPLKDAVELVKSIGVNKESILIAGKHAAIVRNTGKTFEYLELQSAFNSGWHTLTTSELQHRFVIHKTVSKFAGIQRYRPQVLIDVESLSKSDEFKKLLGYINTSAKNQKKNIYGHIK